MRTAAQSLRASLVEIDSALRDVEAEARAVLADFGAERQRLQQVGGQGGASTLLSRKTLVHPSPIRASRSMSFTVLNYFKDKCVYARSSRLWT